VAPEVNKILKAACHGFLEGKNAFPRNREGNGEDTVEGMKGNLKRILRKKIPGFGK
jgi:hypothetical protein